MEHIDSTVVKTDQTTYIVVLEISDRGVGYWFVTDELAIGIPHSQFPVEISQDQQVAYNKSCSFCHKERSVLQSRIKTNHRATLLEEIDKVHGLNQVTLGQVGQSTQRGRGSPELCYICASCYADFNDAVENLAESNSEHLLVDSI